MTPPLAGTRRALVLALGALLATGCGRSEAASTVMPAAATAALPTSTDEPPTPTGVSGGCPVPRGVPAELGVDATPGSILAFLNAGGAVPVLSDRLHAMGVAGAPQDAARMADFNSDGLDDVAIALSGPPASGGGPVILLLCHGDQYILGEPLVHGDEGTAPILHAGADLTADSGGDVLVGWRSCGAHTCQQRLEVLSVSGMRVDRHALEPSLDVPFPEIAILADGSVGVTAGSVGSIGAGPFRRFTRTWRWDASSQSFALVSEDFEPARHRIHVLLDADAAARSGDLPSALELYHRVVQDETLLDWVDPTAERANLTGYAMFRVVLTYLGIHDVGDAQKAYGILQNQYPPGAAGQAYAAMGQAFWDVYSETGDAERGCRAAQAFADAHPDEILAPLYFGYANPTYASADVCPIAAP